MKMYDEGNIGIAIGSGFVETHAGNLHVYADRTQAGNIVFITTDNFKKYIPIEWLDTYCTDSDIGLRDNDTIAIRKLVEDWKEENEKETEELHQ